MKINEKCNVLYFTADDDLSEILSPCLVEAGADLDCIYAVHDMLPFTLGDDSVEQMIEEHQIKIMIVDPIQEYMGHDVYQASPEDTYPIIIKLADIANRYGCAVILVAYSQGFNGKNRLLWQEFAEKVSSIICIDKEEKVSRERLLIHEKCFLSQEGELWKFKLEDLCKNMQQIIFLLN